MQSWEKSASTSQRFDIFLFDAFSNHCLANTVEPLRAANTLAGRVLYEWRFCTTQGDPVLSSSGLKVTPHHAVAAAQGDTLVLMPSYGVRRIPARPLARTLLGVAARYNRLAGFDTGSWLLAQAGLLDGYTATIHWDETTAFAERFPEVDVVRERFTKQGVAIDLLPGLELRQKIETREVVWRIGTCSSQHCWHNVD